MDVTTHQLRCFLAVARTLHFASAAGELHLSSSAVSEQIKALEHRIGQELFHRTSRRVELTEAGRHLLPIAQRAVASHDDVLNWAQRWHREELSIGLMVSNLGFREALSKAADTYPDVHWEVRNIGFQGCFTALAQGQVDCVFTAHMGTQPPVGVVFHPLYSEPSVLVVPANHPLGQRHSVKMEEIWDQDFIAPRLPIDPQRADLRDPAALQDPWMAGLEPQNIRHFAATFDEVVELCGAGLGVNVAAASAMSTHPHPRVRFLPITDGPVITTYFSHRTRDVNRTLEAFTRIVLSLQPKSPQTAPD